MSETTALAAALDRHWMDWNEVAKTAVCSCGGWQFDAERDIVVGEHFAPFSKHVAEALHEQGYRIVREDALDPWLRDAEHQESVAKTERDRWYYRGKQMAFENAQRVLRGDES